MGKKTEVISVRIDEKMHDELLGISEELGISLSAAASHCLRIYLRKKSENDKKERRVYE